MYILYLRIIECLPRFVEPLLDLIAEHTGWKVSLIAGGPEPIRGGRLNMMRYVSIPLSFVYNMLIMYAMQCAFGGHPRHDQDGFRPFGTGGIQRHHCPCFWQILRKCYRKSSCNLLRVVS